MHKHYDYAPLVDALPRDRVNVNPKHAQYDHTVRQVDKLTDNQLELALTELSWQMDRHGYMAAELRELNASYYALRLEYKRRGIRHDDYPVEDWTDDECGEQFEAV